MEWAYVAGYFDGEGSVSLHPISRGKSKRTHAMFWFNSHRPSLEAIRTFIGAGNIHQRPQRAYQKQSVCVLQVSRKVDLLRIIDAMIPHLLVKREKAEALRAYLVDHVNEERMVNFGKVAAVSTDQLRAWYAQGESLNDIARRLGVGYTSVQHAFRTRRLKVRRSGCRLGVPKKPETRARMIATRRAMWANPEFVARQAMLREQRKLAKHTP